METDPLILDGKSFHSRFMLGTARYPDPSTLREALEVGGVQIITLSMRRLDRNTPGILELLDPKDFTLLPNTAGCYTARDAVLTAQMAREATGTNWIKLEVCGDDDTLYPNTAELLLAAERLVSEGFVVFPFCTDDPVVCKRLAEMGCEAVMPLVSPIGSGMGVCNSYNLEMIRSLIEIPIIVAGGIGSPMDVVQIFELGVDAVMLNTAVAQSDDPVMMAKGINHAAKAGRLGYLAGRIPKQRFATASSPMEGVMCAP